MFDLKNYTKEELIFMLDTIHDTSLQNNENKFWWICFDIEKQKELFEILKKNQIWNH